MLDRFIHSKYAVIAPALPVLLLLVVYVGFQLLFVGTQIPIKGLFVQDRSVVVDDTSGALRFTPRPVPAGADAKTRAKLEEKNAAARVRALNSAARRHASRLVWMFFAGLGMLTSILGLVTAALMLLRSSSELQDRYWRRYAITFGGALLLGFLQFATRIAIYLTEPVFRNTIRNGVLGERRIVEVTNVAISLALAASVALVIACCALLVPARMKPTDPDSDVDFSSDSQLQRDLAPIKDRLRSLRAFLYVAMLLLVVGVLRMQTEMDWALTFVAPRDAEALAPWTSTVSSVVGAFFSLVLAGVYLPAAFVLKARAEAVIDKARVTAQAKATIRENTVFSQSLTAVLPRLAALMGPLLAGPFAALLQRLVGS